MSRKSSPFNCRTYVLLALLLTLLTSINAFSAPPPGYKQHWKDTFDGPVLNPENWTMGLRDPASNDLVPGARGRYLLNSAYAGYITEEDVVVSNGSLNLLNRKHEHKGTDPAGTFNFTSGWVMSMHKVHFNKGYIEWRAKFPSGDKVWPALWLISEKLVWGPEWDCFEYFGQRADQGFDNMGLHLFHGKYPDGKWSNGWLRKFDATYDCEAWHVYGFEWTGEYARWFIDGKMVRDLKNTLGTHWPDEEMYIVMNNGVKADSPDKTTTWPNSLTIDYVALYIPSSLER